jgi:hypothetical protein
MDPFSNVSHLNSNTFVLQVGSNCKKPRLEPGVMQSPVMATTPTSSASRRSQRQRRVRGEKEIVVSSDQKLRDLKVEVSFETFKF